jgi:quercetin dioxygenase-like cupin family protein
VHRLRAGDRRGHRARLRRIELTGEREVTAAGSVSARVRRLAAEAHAVVIEIAPGGVVARHPAGVPQLFVVVSGSGWVSGANGEREAIQAGGAILWDQGEEHESGSETGMRALVVEAESLDV